MKRKTINPVRLEDLPNIGENIAADLKSIGVLTPQDLSKHDPLTTYMKLSKVMGHRHDPCVFYTLLSTQHYFETGETSSWWNFTVAGKKILAEMNK